MKRAFTLIEAVMFVVIVALLVGIAIPACSGGRHQPTTHKLFGNALVEWQARGDRYGNWNRARATILRVDGQTAHFETESGHRYTVSVFSIDWDAPNVEATR